MNHQIMVMLFTAQVVLASGQGDKELKTSCLLQQGLSNQPLQLNDETAEVGAHAEYLRSALVMVKELASNVTKWDTNLSKSEREALQLIKDFINALKKSAINSHDEDQREVTRAKKLIEDCARVANDALIGRVNEAKTTMIGSRRDHNSCRTSEADCQRKENDFCGKWDSYRKSNTPNSCAGVDFKNDMNSDAPDTKDAVEKCLLEIQPFYSQYVECWKPGECVKKMAPLCDTNQTKFEGDYCSYSKQLSDTCDDQKDCRQREISFRNDTHRDVAANEAARKADYITSQKVLCYFKVFESNNTNKTAILRGCEKLAVNTSHLNISYPAIPAAQVCVVAPSQPCDNAWVNTEYDSKPWKKHVTMLDCQPCPKAVYRHIENKYCSRWSDHTTTWVQHGSLGNCQSACNLDAQCTACNYLCGSSEQYWLQVTGWTCDEIDSSCGSYIEYKQAVPPPGFSPKCPHEPDWQYLLDYGDDRSKNDIPDVASEVVKGFSNSNAYFVGKEFLKTMTASKIEICARNSRDSCKGVCTTLDSSLEMNCVCDAAADLTSKEAQVAMIMSGGCGALSTSCGKDKAMLKFTEQVNGDQSGWVAGNPNTKRMLASRVDSSWHFWGMGVTLAISGATYQFNCVGDHNVEFGWHCTKPAEKNDYDVLQVRVKP